jgi:pimeloyl-ACP methyl ester carboxylesterase
MTMLMTTDGTQLSYNHWGSGQAVVFSHGWPLSADVFEDQMFFWPRAGTGALLMIGAVRPIEPALARQRLGHPCR